MVNPAASAPGIGSRFFGFVKTTSIGGALVLLPLAGCIYIISAAISAVQSLVKPIEPYVPIHQFGGVALLLIIAAAVVVAVSFCLGLLIETTVGRMVSQRFSRIFSKVLPGYSIFKALSRQVARKPDEKLGAPLLVMVGCNRQFGFLVEEHASGEMTVFIPAAPALIAGSILIVPAECVERLDASIAQVAGCIQTYGIGSSKLIPQERRSLPSGA